MSRLLIYRCMPLKRLAERWMNYNKMGMPFQASLLLFFGCKPGVGRTSGANTIKNRCVSFAH